MRNLRYRSAARRRRTGAPVPPGESLSVASPEPQARAGDRGGTGTGNRPLLPAREPGLYLWVPKTCATWADALKIAVGSVPRSGAGRAGLGPSGDGMIFGLWA